MEHPESEKPDAVSNPAGAEGQAGEDEFPDPPVEGPGLETEPDVEESEEGYGA